MIKQKWVTQDVCLFRNVPTIGFILVNYYSLIILNCSQQISFDNKWKFVFNTIITLLCTVSKNWQIHFFIVPIHCIKMFVFKNGIMKSHKMNELLLGMCWKHFFSDNLIDRKSRLFIVRNVKYVKGLNQIGSAKNWGQIKLPTRLMADQ